ncbi:MAG: hypothetical protein ACHRHE_04750 [Tepidisphaerales bacterium]
MSQQATGFYISGFGIDGEIVDTVFRTYSTLSEKWLTVCSRFLAMNGDVFESSWEGPLSHIKTRLTLASGAAVLTMFTGDQIECSMLLLSGLSTTADNDAASMFVTSLRNINMVKAAATSAEPFGGILTARERPLLAGVVWPDPGIPAGDHQLIGELMLHLAGAFFTRVTTMSQ